MSETIRVGFKRLNDDATLPTKAHASDSGYDLYASEDVIIETGETAIVPTGIAVQLPEGYEATVRPRSGVTSKSKLRVQLGTIDNGYNGEIGIIVDNIKPSVESTWNRITNTSGAYEKLGDDLEVELGAYLVRKGDKIAQLVVQPLPAVEAYEITGDMGETERGRNGFGSSGISAEGADL